jgi:hypothetical protein
MKITKTELKNIIHGLIEEAKSPADVKFLKAFDKSFIQTMMNELDSAQDQWSYDDSPNLEGTIRNRQLLKILERIRQDNDPFDGQIIKITNDEGEIVITGNIEGFTIYKDGKALTETTAFEDLLDLKRTSVSEVEAFTTWVSRGDESGKAFRKRYDRKQNPDERGEDPAKTVAVETLAKSKLIKQLVQFGKQISENSEAIVESMIDNNNSLTREVQIMIDESDMELSDYHIKQNLRNK